MPTPQDNKALTRRWFEEVWNKRRKEAVYELAHPDVVTYGLGEGGVAGGVEQFIPFWQRFLDTFPDMRIEIDDIIAEGDKTAVRLHADATHTGDAMGIAPTNKRVRLTGIILIRWKDGQIIEAWNEFDAWGMMQQIAGPAPMKIKQ
jgi:predicted ester cyclase